MKIFEMPPHVTRYSAQRVAPPDPKHVIECDTRVRQDEGRQLGQLSCKDGDTVAAGNMPLRRKHLETLNPAHMHSQRFSCTVINMGAKFCLVISEQFAYIPRFFLTTAAQCGAEKPVIFEFLIKFFFIIYAAPSMKECFT